MSIYIFNIAIGSLDMFNLILGTDKKPPFMVSSHTFKHLKMPNIYVSISPITLLILFPLSIYNVLGFFVFLAVDFCRFCVVIRFLSLPQRPMTFDFKGCSIPDCIHYNYFLILILEKEPVFPLLMFSAKQGNYWLGIEPETSHSRSQHFTTTRLSRRRWR